MNTEQLETLIKNIDYTTMKSIGHFNQFLEILEDIGLDTNDWIEDSIDVTDEFLDAVDFDEPILSTEIMIKKNKYYELQFKNTSTLDTFDPVYTTIVVDQDQLKLFLIKILHEKLITL